MEIVVDLFNQHSGNLDELKCMAFAARQAGADWVKIQLLDSQKIWGDDSRKYLEMNERQYREFHDFCSANEIKMFATVFTEMHLRWVSQDRFKLASWLVKNDMALCRHVIGRAEQYGRDIFVSTGLSGYNEFPFGYADNLHYMFCVPEYPTLLSNKALKNMPSEFSKYVEGISKTEEHTIDFFPGYEGFSDHTMGFSTALQAYHRGAKYLEKHFTLNPNRQCETEKAHLCSFTPGTLRLFRNLIDELDVLNGVDR